MQLRCIIDGLGEAVNPGFLIASGPSSIFACSPAQRACARGVWMLEYLEDCSEIVGDFARNMLTMRNMQITVVTCVARLYV